MIFFKKLERSILGGGLIIGFFSFVSRIFGLVRDQLLAGTFSAGDISDAYFAAFRIPDFLFNIFVLGTLSSAFIPVFVSLWKKDQERNKEHSIDEAESWRVANSILTLLVIVVALACVIFFLFTNPLVSIIAPGYSQEKRQIIAQLSRIMMLGVLFFTASNVIAGVLNSFRRFVAYSLAPVLYNVGIIIGILWLYPRFGNAGLAWGVVLGSFFHLAIQLPSAWRVGFRFRPILDWTHTGVRRIGKLMIPRTIGLGVAQINLVVVTSLASRLDSGDLTVFTLANNLQHFPISIFGISLAVSAFPVFSQAISENNRESFVFHFSKTFREILFFLIPISIAIVLLRAQIVRIVYGRNQFDWEDTYRTAQVLGVFAISLFAQSVTPLLARSFYAHEDTKTPLYIGILTVIVNILLAVPLASRFGVFGLAVAFSVSSILDMILLLIILRARVGNLEDSKIVESIIRVLAASAVLGVAVQSMKYIIAPLVDMQTGVGVLIQASVSALAGALFYLVLSVTFHFEEVAFIREWVAKILRLLKNGNGHA